MESVNKETAGSACHAIIFLPNDFLRQAINAYPTPVGIPADELCPLCNDFCCEHVGTRLMLTWVPKQGPLDALHIYYGPPSDGDPNDREIKELHHTSGPHNPGQEPTPTGGNFGNYEGVEPGNNSSQVAEFEAPPANSTEEHVNAGETKFGNIDAIPEFFPRSEPKAEFQNFEAESEPNSFELEPEHNSFEAEPEHNSFEAEPDHNSFEAEPEHSSFEAEPEHNSFDAEQNCVEAKPEFFNIEAEAEYYNSFEPEPEPEHNSFEAEPEFFNIEPVAEFYNSFEPEAEHNSFESEIGFRSLSSHPEPTVSPFCTIDTLTRQVGELSCNNEPMFGDIYDPNYSNFGSPDLAAPLMKFDAIPRHRNFQPKTRNVNRAPATNYYPRAESSRPRPQPQTKSNKPQLCRQMDGSYLVPCQFCFSNGETPAVFNAHQLRNSSGVVQCPILRKFVCPTCNATGDNAHTEKYCPERNDTLHVYRKVRTAFGKYKILRY